MKKYLLLAAVILGLGVFLTSEAQKPAYQSELGDAFGELLEGIEEAERNLTSPVAMAPPLEERRLVAGYAYLLGHLVRIVGSEVSNTPESPHFERAVTFLSKWTGDNPDNAYLQAPIDGSFSYRVTGRTPYYRNMTAKTLHDVPQAPGVVIFQTTTNTIGDTGSLKELTSCRNQTLATLDSFGLKVAPDGSFDILLSPERPVGYDGNWLATSNRLPCKNRDGSTVWTDRVAKKFVIREIFVDWTQEQPLDLDIVRIGFEGVPPAKMGTDERAGQLRAIGEKLPNQVTFWNWVMQVGLEAWGDRNFDGELRLPVNDVNPPAPPFLAGGTAGSGQLYASGMFSLEDDEALLLEIEVPVMPDYLGFHLGDAWMQSLDQANYVTSRNHAQMEFDNTGNSYLVIAHTDPGIRNWIDTTGMSTGQMIFRFWYADPPEQDVFPNLKVRKFHFEDRDKVLAGKNPTPVNAEQRREEIATRQKHMRLRLREY